MCNLNKLYEELRVSNTRVSCAAMVLMSGYLPYRVYPSMKDSIGNEKALVKSSRMQFKHEN